VDKRDCARLNETGGDNSKLNAAKLYESLLLLNKFSDIERSLLQFNATKRCESLLKQNRCDQIRLNSTKRYQTKLKATGAKYTATSCLIVKKQNMRD
jgi:hypothetical protein